MSKNLILWVIDQQHKKEQLNSYASVAKHMPDVDTRTWIVPSGDLWYEKYIKVLRESLAEHNNQGELYDSFIFLDSDTYLTEPIYDVFDILTKYDIVSTHAPARQTTNMPTEPKLPSGYCELNTGLLGYRNGAIVRTLFDGWRDNYHRLMTVSGDNDQSALRLTMWEQDTRVWVLPPEYNFRAGFGGFASGRVKLLHIRYPNATMEQIEAWANKDGGMRLLSSKDLPK